MTAKKDLSDIYIITHNSAVFQPLTVVKFITCTYSGDCYLVADLNNDIKREWIMYYDLYPIDWKSKNNQYRWYYNSEYHKIADALIIKHQLY